MKIKGRMMLNQIFRRFPALDLLPVTLLFLFISGCSLFEYDDPSDPVGNQAPETYLSLTALDTIYATVDSITIATDPETGGTYSDTVWSYLIGERPDDQNDWKVLDQAFHTISTSRQALHWWGEDPDGNILGYWIRWNSDNDWTYTSREDSVFYVPIKRDMDVFSFEVAAMDNDSITDETPARLAIPIRNSAPRISFRARSNPKLSSLTSDTTFTFPTRTFIWDIDDQDGRESVTDVFYALDDTCETCWTTIDAQVYNEITLEDLEVGFHTFFLKTRDIAGAESDIVHFPDTSIIDEPDYWKVKPIVGNILLVDDFPQDSRNRAMKWFSGVVDSVFGGESYSVWEPGTALPSSNTDLYANLSYFDHVLWMSAYSGQEVYDDAGSSVYKYILNGGNLFISVAEIKDTSFVWFPIDTTYTIGKNYYQLSPQRVLSSQVSGAPDLSTPQDLGIYVELSAFENEPGAEYKDLYKLPEPVDMFDEWVGTPTVAGIYEPAIPSSAGKSVFLTLPIHNGYDPLLDGNGNFGLFLKYLVEDLFSE